MAVDMTQGFLHQEGFYMNANIKILLRVSGFIFLAGTASVALMVSMVVLVMYAYRITDWALKVLP